MSNRHSHYFIAGLIALPLLACTARPAASPTIPETCSDTIDAVYRLPGGLAPFDMGRRGEVLRCASDRALTAGDVGALLASNGYTGPAPSSGVRVYRIAYRTARVLSPESRVRDGVTSAVVLVPDVPRPGVLVVAGHGSEGLAERCAPSRLGLTYTLYYGLAGAGWTVIAPDYAGFGYGSTSGWLLAEDEAHSLLDATRAMARLLPERSFPKVALVGHSQGGHAVLAAQAMARGYGLEGDLVGVAAFAPVWFSALTWGALLSPQIGFTTENAPGLLTDVLFYFFGHGEVYEGPEGGVALLAPGPRAALRDLLTSECTSGVIARLPSLGRLPTDLVDPRFADPVASCSLSGSCDGEPAGTWRRRFQADRPAVDPRGAPIVIWQGRADTTLPPDRAKCGFDRIMRDLQTPERTATFTVCGDPDADHVSIVDRNIDWVTQWIAGRAEGMADPPCPGPGPLAPDNGAPLVCATPPPNID